MADQFKAHEKLGLETGNHPESINVKWWLMTFEAAKNTLPEIHGYDVAIALEVIRRANNNAFIIAGPSRDGRLRHQAAA